MQAEREQAAKCSTGDKNTVGVDANGLLLPGDAEDAIHLAEKVRKAVMQQEEERRNHKAAQLVVSGTSSRRGMYSVHGSAPCVVAHDSRPAQRVLGHVGRYSVRFSTAVLSCSFALPHLVLLACLLEDLHLWPIQGGGQVLPLLRVEALGAVLQVVNRTPR
jgi:hypothetical protein